MDHAAEDELLESGYRYDGPHEPARRIGECPHCQSRTSQRLELWQDFDLSEEGPPDIGWVDFPGTAYVALCDGCNGVLLYLSVGEYTNGDLDEFAKAALAWPPSQEKKPPADQYLASAARFLIDGGGEDAANVMLSCRLEFWESGDTWWVGDEQHRALHVKLTGPRAAHDVLVQEDHPTTQAILEALAAVLPDRTYVKHFTAHVELVDIDRDWREELLEIARGQGVHNNVVRLRDAQTWMNLRFRSASEIKVAEALDRANLLFWPNAMARLGAETRQNREADFLVCAEGRFGILEVDGEPFHPPSRTAADHERDRLFKSHGIRVVEHFDANECFNDPDGVVRRFLSILGT
jgi:hypothetical protein